MASELYADVGTSISTTEYSLPNDANYNSANGILTDAVIQALIDFANMAAGDQYEVKIYDKVYSGGTQRKIYHATLTGPQDAPLVTPAIVLMHAWDVTVKRLAGSDRSISWSIRAG